MDVILKKFDNPEEVLNAEKSKFEIVNIGGMKIARATFQPGMRWSTHIGATQGKTICDIEHIGVVLSGNFVVVMNGGKQFELNEGDVFHIPPGHDGWVVGDKPYVSLHLLGSSEK